MAGHGFVNLLLDTRDISLIDTLCIEVQSIPALTLEKLAYKSLRKTFSIFGEN